MSKYYIIKPHNLDLEARLKQFPPNFDFNIDFAHMVINDIIHANAYLPDADINGNNFIQRSSVILKSFNRLYDKHMKYLCDNIPAVGNVLWRQNYSVGKCYSYKLAPFYQRKNLIVHALTDKNLIKKINNKIAVKIVKIVPQKYAFLKGYLDPKNLTIQLDESMLRNDQLLATNNNYKKYLLNMIEILKLQNGKFFMSHNSKTDGRIHSNITTSPKEFRKFMRYQGKIIAEVDIAASVPTFLYFILKNIKSDNKHINNIINIKSNYYNHYMLAKNTVNIDIKEIERFGKLILTGEFYQTLTDGFISLESADKILKPNTYLMKAVESMFERKYNGNPNDLNKVVKKNILSMMNSKSSQYKNEQAVFKHHFPSIHKFITELKKENHRCFSYLMLQTESYFMLQIVARKLNKDFSKKIPILTLHDCIISTVENLGRVKNFMETTFNAELGFTPMLKAKVYQ